MRTVASTEVLTTEGFKSIEALKHVIDRTEEYHEVDSVENLTSYKDANISIIRSGLAADGKFKKRIFGYESQHMMKVLGFFIMRGRIVGTKVMFSKKDKKMLSKYRRYIFEMTGEKGVISVRWDGVHTLTFSSLTSVLKDFAFSTKDKQIPEFVWELDASLLSSLYEGICEAGRLHFIPKGGHSLNLQHATTSPKLRDDFMRLSAHLGLSSTFCVMRSPAHISTVHGKEKNFKESFSFVLSMSRSKRISVINRRKRSRIENSTEGVVFHEVKTSRKHPVFMRQNNKMFLSAF